MSLKKLSQLVVSLFHALWLDLDDWGEAARNRDAALKQVSVFMDLGVLSPYVFLTH
jgi:hypothetical protein